MPHSIRNTDGQRVRQVAPDGTTTVYIGQWYEESQSVSKGSVRTNYYYFGGQRVALRTGAVGQGQDTLYWLHTDHLGSTSEASTATASLSGQERYFPYGQVRYSSGSIPTTYNYTGQRLDYYIKLLEMGARWYDPAIGRFVSPDTIVPQPGNPQSLNRYSYGYNNPVRYTDPSGHDPLDAEWLAAFRAAHDGRDPTHEDIVLRLFSLAFYNEFMALGGWSYFEKGGTLDKTALGQALTEPGGGRDWAHMDTALANLARWYKPDERYQFVRDIGSLFGGLEDRFHQASTKTATGVQPFFQRFGHAYIGRTGLPEYLTGNTDRDANVHHWAWALVLGYDQGAEAAQRINYNREWVDGCLGRCMAWEDVELGWRAAQMGQALSVAPITPASVRSIFFRYLPEVYRPRGR